MTLIKTIGEKIRSSRQTLHLTLTQLSKQSSVSVALLSKIENGQVSSPISTYAKITDALGISLSDLFASDGKESGILVERKNDRESNTDSGKSEYEFTPLCKEWPNKDFSIFMMTYSPGDNSQRSPNFTFPGEEFFYVMNGQLGMHYGNQYIELNEGDSLFIDASVPHGGRCIGDSKTHVLMISVPYNK